MASFSNSTARRVAAAGTLLALAGCVAAPPVQGPRVVAMPGTGKSYEQFQADDASCRQAAFAQVGPGPSAQDSNNAVVGSAVAGTALGAVAGAAIGSASGNLGGGAAVGGALGLLAGSAVGAGNARAGGANAQYAFDTAYSQCMYAKGNQVPSSPPPQPGYGYGGGTVIYGAPGVYVGPEPYYHRYWRPYP